MDNYIVSARKYRPATFHSVVGQHALTTTLKNAIVTNKLAHAYLFSGPRGVGKTTCARIFAKTINCLNITPDHEACNECESCKAFNEQRSFNILELDAASNNSVDDIRSLIEQVRIPPQIGKYKVYIIDEVHMLSSAAFNSFLKTLEEPPLHAIFILATTEKHKVLPTILSRCQVYDFSRISVNDTVQHLEYVAQTEGVTYEPEALNIIAQKADGGMRDALSIFDQCVSFTGGQITYKSVIDNLNVLDYEYYFKLSDAILAGDVVSCLLTLNDILNHGFDGQYVVTGITSHFRDLLVCRDSATVELMPVGASIKKRYEETARKCDPLFLYKAIELANECDLNYRVSKNKRLLIELMLIRLCQLNSNKDTQSNTADIQPLQPINASAPTNTPNAGATPPQTPHTDVAQPSQTPSNTTPSQTTPTHATPNSVPGKAAVAPQQKIKVPSMSFSITNKKKVETESEKEETEPQITQILTNPFTAEQLVSAWISFAESLDEMHLKHIMLNYEPVIVDSNNVKVVVPTETMIDSFQSVLPRLKACLFEKLQNNSFTLSFEVAPIKPKLKQLTEREKYQLLVSQNNHLMELVDELQLEFR